MKNPRILLVACVATLFAAPNLIAQAPQTPQRSDEAQPVEPATPAATSPSNAEEFVPDEVLVGFKPGAAAAQRDRVREGVGAKKIKEFARIDVQHWKLPPGLTVARAIELLSKNPNVRFAEPNYIVRTNDIVLPNDELRGDLWGMHNVGQNGGSADADIDALEAWQLAPGSGAVVVGVIDTGIDYNHPDLAGKMWINPREIAGNGLDDDGNGYIDDVAGWDFVNNDNDPFDDNHHGTHVAGTIAAQGNDGRGVIGVAGLNPNVKLLPIKFLNSGGSGSTDAAISAVLYAASLKDAAGNQIVRITNNSWGGGASSDALKSAIETSNSLFVAAAGNSGSSSVQYPAGYALPNVLAVAATDFKDTLATFSNYGSWVHLAAPGVSIISTTPGNTYSRFNGTSMATPHVAGAAAMVLSQNPGLNPVSLKQQLLDTGDAKSALDGKVIGSKRLNVAAALGAGPLPPDTTTPDAVSSLVASNPTQTSVELAWPAGTGAAYLYDVRYRTNSAVDDNNWSSATSAYGEPVPPAAGHMLVEDLTPGVSYYFAIRAVNRDGVTSALANAAASTLAIEWKSQTVDTQGEVGDYRSLAFNASGDPVIAYSDQTNNRVKVATRNGSTWALDAFGTGNGGVSLALIPAGLAGAGAPSVSWAASKLYFATKASGSWSLSTIEKGSVQGDTTSLAYGPDGAPSISYRLTSTSGGLKFAWRAGSTWKTQIVAARAGARYSALAFAPNGTPMIAFSDDVNTDNSLETLKLAVGTNKTANGYTWTVSTVETGVVGYGVFCSLAFDAASNPYIVHQAAGAIRFVRRSSGGAWVTDVLASGSGCNLTVARDGANVEHAYVAYSSGGRVNVARTALTEPLTWKISLADIETFSGGTPSIKVAGGLPSIAYNITGDLRLTTEAPGYAAPTFSLFDDMENVSTEWTTTGNDRDPTAKNLPPTEGSSNLWHRSVRRGNDPGHTPVYSWYYGIDAQNTYDTGTRNWGRLVSPPVTLTGTRAELKVSQLVNAEGGRLENGEIQIKAGTSPWTTIFQRSSRTNTSFITDKVDLSAYLGATIQIGFFFDTKDANFNNYEGWYVDDVSVKVWP